MALPPAHKRWTVYGVLEQAVGGGSEIFDFGVADQSGLTVRALADAIAPIVSDYWDAHSLGISSHAFLTGVMVESISDTGKVISSYNHGLAQQVGDNQNGLPTICCNCLTLETGQTDNRGRKIRGRFYPPATLPQVVGSTSTINTALPYAQAWKNLFQDLIAAGADPCVASTTDGGQIVDVVGLTCDTVIDTQRGRKNHVTTQRTALVPF